MRSATLSPSGATVHLCRRRDRTIASRCSGTPAARLDQTHDVHDALRPARRDRHADCRSIGSAAGRRDRGWARHPRDQVPEEPALAVAHDGTAGSRWISGRPPVAHPPWIAHSLFRLPARRLPYNTVRGVFLHLLDRISLVGAHSGRDPRIHDLRHTFAVRSLEQCRHDRAAVCPAYLWRSAPTLATRMLPTPIGTCRPRRS